MANYVQVPPDSTGKKVDAVSMDVGADTVMRQRICLASGTGTATFAAVMSSEPAGTEGGLVTRSILAGTMGGVSVVDTANTALRVSIVTDISSTAVIAGVVGLTAGSQNIGYINHISQTVVCGLAYVLEKTSNSQVMVGDSANASIRVSIVADLSATAVIAGQISLAAGTANIGFLNNISATVIAQRGPIAIPSASHGPKCVTLSTSATVALVAAPGAGLSIFVTSIACGNGSATLTRADVYQASGTASCVCQMYMAASGGGFVIQYDPPLQVLSNTALNARVKPSVSQAIFNINFYVAAG